MEPPETIAAGELTLRRWEPDMTEEATAAVVESLAELTPFMPWVQGGYDVDSSREFIQRSAGNWAKGTEYNYAVLAPDGTLAGSIGLMARVGPGALEVGYWLRSSCTGRGWMTTAVEALTRVALELPGIERTVIKHDAANVRSGAVARRAGYTEIERVPRTPEAPGETGTDVIWERTVHAG